MLRSTTNPAAPTPLAQQIDFMLRPFFTTAAPNIGASSWSAKLEKLEASRSVVSLLLTALGPQYQASAKKCLQFLFDLIDELLDGGGEQQQELKDAEVGSIKNKGSSSSSNMKQPPQADNEHRSLALSPTKSAQSQQQQQPMRITPPPPRVEPPRTEGLDGEQENGERDFDVMMASVEESTAAALQKRVERLTAQLKRSLKEAETQKEHLITQMNDLTREKERVEELLLGSKGSATPLNSSIVPNPPIGSNNSSSSSSSGGAPRRQITGELSVKEAIVKEAIRKMLTLHEPTLEFVPEDTLFCRPFHGKVRLRSLKNAPKDLLAKANAPLDEDEEMVDGDLLILQTENSKIRCLDVNIKDAITREVVSKAYQEKQVRERDTRIKDLEEQVSGLQAQVEQLRTLNGEYAMQAIEIAARIRVLMEQNDKFSSALALQQDEQMTLEKENEILKAELVDLARLNQLREGYDSDGAPVKQPFELRGIRFTVGNNKNIPRHLACNQLLQRVPIPRETAQMLIRDIVMQWRATVQSNSNSNSISLPIDFPSFIHRFLTKKYGVDAFAWAYSLDDATHFFDSDVNMSIYGFTSRKVLSHHFFGALVSDIQLFLEACEMIDSALNPESSYRLHIVHVLGLLVEMFPSYPESAFRRIVEQLQETLQGSKGIVFYSMLFPNMEREIIAGVDVGLAGTELRKENVFSSIFKELILDDAMLTMQLLEDALQDEGGEKLVMLDVMNAIGGVFDDDEIRRDVTETLRNFYSSIPGLEQLEVPQSKALLIQLLRSRAVFRRGVYRPGGEAPPRGKAYFTQFKRDFQIQNAGETIHAVNYREVIQRCTTKRFIIDAAQIGQAVGGE